MDKNRAIFLFDVDGVLVNPGAYKAAIVRTLELLFQKIGLRNGNILLPVPSEIAFMESRGIHDVWDMTAIIFSLVLFSLYETLQKTHTVIDPGDNNLLDRFSRIAGCNCAPERPNYNQYADKIASYNVHPPDAALQTINALLNNSVDAMENKAADDNTHVLHSWKSLIQTFLSDTRSVYKNYATRLFQNIVLGAREFESTYLLPSQYSGEALLKTEDLPLLEKSLANRIIELQQTKKIEAAVYTARPSRPPADLGHINGYSPEAESAAELAGLGALPLVGMGMMEWLAFKNGKRTEGLTKPNITHSLSTLLAAVTNKNESEIFQLALEFTLQSPGSPVDLPLSRQEPILAYIFEDTTSGINPMLKLQENLRFAGYQFTAIPLGISEDQNKRSALEPLCKHVFPDVNKAIRFALFDLGYS